MKKRIWILNHYSTGIYFNRGGRHYWLARRLQELGYDVEVFSANRRHNNKEEVVTDTYSSKFIDGIKLNMISTTKYDSNNYKRVINMYSFYKNLKKYKRQFSKPDIVIASSVHLLTLYAGLNIAKYYKTPLISEVRDLWPESLIAYGTLKEESPISKLLYRMEKYIYKKSDKIIMTWEGGKKYIIEKKWDKVINVDKVHFITNGVDIESFNMNREKFSQKYANVFNPKDFNIIYTGSIRKVNNLKLLVDLAKYLENYRDIKFYIYGDGPEKKELESIINDLKLENIKFMGRIAKNEIPGVINYADVNILHNKSTRLDKYGQSQNKLFEYLAAGKPVIQTYYNDFSIVEKHNAGIVCRDQNVKEVAKAILNMYHNSELKKEYAINAFKAAEYYDFKRHAKKIDSMIKELV